MAKNSTNKMPSNKKLELAIDAAMHGLQATGVAKFGAERLKVLIHSRLTQRANSNGGGAQQ